MMSSKYTMTLCHRSSESTLSISLWNVAGAEHDLPVASLQVELAEPLPFPQLIQHFTCPRQRDLVLSVLHTVSGVHWLRRGIHNGWGLCRGPGCPGDTNPSCCGSAKEHDDFAPSGLTIGGHDWTSPHEAACHR
ncbi:hypothetical protein ABBQ32_005149 [Trebouxia sp. C0010 RCD-2024]